MPNDEKGPLQITREYVQPDDAISFFAEQGQVFRTGNEIILQLYETIPGPPAGKGGVIEKVRTRLRATVTLSPAHARNLAELILKRATQDPESAPEVASEVDRS